MFSKELDPQPSLAQLEDHVRYMQEALEHHQRSISRRIQLLEQREAQKDSNK